MEEPISPSFVQRFYEAYAGSSPAGIAAFLADDIEWKVSGPVDIIPFCGHWRGKAAVLDFIYRVRPTIFRRRRVELEDIVIEGNQAAVFFKSVSVHTQTGRTVVFYVAHFLEFRDGKLVNLNCLGDTFDAVEQIMGHRIDVYREPVASPSEDIVAI